MLPVVIPVAMTVCKVAAVVVPSVAGVVKTCVVAGYAASATKFVAGAYVAGKAMETASNVLLK